MEEELDNIDIDDIVNLEDLPGLVFIVKECGNPEVVTDGGEFTRNINQKNLDVLQAYGCLLCNKCCRQEYIFNKHVEYCESVR